MNGQSEQTRTTQTRDGIKQLTLRATGGRGRVGRMGKDKERERDGRDSVHSQSVSQSVSRSVAVGPVCCPVLWVESAAVAATLTSVAGSLLLALPLLLKFRRIEVRCAMRR